MFAPKKKVVNRCRKSKTYFLPTEGLRPLGLRRKLIVYHLGYSQIIIINWVPEEHWALVSSRLYSLTSVVCCAVCRLQIWPSTPPVPVPKCPCPVDLSALSLTWSSAMWLALVHGKWANVIQAKAWKMLVHWSLSHSLLFETQPCCDKVRHSCWGMRGHVNSGPWVPGQPIVNQPALADPPSEQHWDQQKTSRLICRVMS